MRCGARAMAAMMMLVAGAILAIVPPRLAIAGERPTLTLWPTNVAFARLSSSNTDFPVSNVSALVGPPDGAFATCNLAGTSTAFQSNEYLLSFSIPPEAAGGIFDAVGWTVYGVSQTSAVADSVGWNLAIVDRGGVKRGQADGVHEFAALVRNRDPSAFRGRIGPGRVSYLHVASSGSTRDTILGFDQFGGVRISAQVYSLATAGTASIDAVSFTFPYTPRDPGVPLALPTTSVAEVTASAAGIAVPGGLTEVAWTNVANARTANTSRATITPPNLDGQSLPGSGSGLATRFLSYRWTPGSLALRGVRSPVQLRAFVKGNFAQFAGVVGASADRKQGEPLPECFIDEIALRSSTGSVIAKLSDGSLLTGDRDPYGTTTYAIANFAGQQTATGSASFDLVYVGTLGIGHLSESQIADIDADRGNNESAGSILVRFRAPVRLYPALTTDVYPFDHDPNVGTPVSFDQAYDVVAPAVNDITFTMSFGSASGGGVAAASGATGASGNSTSRQREGSRLMTPVSVQRPALPASLIVPVASGQNFRDAVVGLGASNGGGWQYVDLPETGSARPVGLRISALLDPTAAAGTTSVMQVLGVVRGVGETLILEDLGEATFVWPNPLGSADMAGLVTPSGVSVSAPSVVKGTTLTAVSERPACVDVKNLSVRYSGIALRVGNGSAGAGKPLTPVVTRTWE